MKPIIEKLLIKDATINKIQYDKECFFYLEDIKNHLKEDLSAVEFIFMPLWIDGKQEFVKFVSFEDIIRGRKELK
jgi:hypothetical protein